MIALASIVAFLLGLELGFYLARRQLLRAVEHISRVAQEHIIARHAEVDTALREVDGIMREAEHAIASAHQRQALLDTLRAATPPRAN